MAPSVEPVEVFPRATLRPTQEQYFRDGFLYYLGPVQERKAHGRGKLFWKNGKVRYEGEFQEGRFHGQGTLYDQKGRRWFQGEFRGGRFQVGTYYSQAGDVMYEGTFPPPTLRVDSSN
jgi:hypothetical protein